MLRTPEQLQQMLEERKRIQQRKKEREKQRYKKASEKVQQQLKRKYNKNKKQSQPKEKKVQIIHYTVSIYHSNLIERELDENELYTKEELQNIETLYPNETGRINWTVYQQLVNKLQNSFNTL